MNTVETCYRQGCEADGPVTVTDVMTMAIYGTSLTCCLCDRCANEFMELPRFSNMGKWLAEGVTKEVDGE